MIMLWLRYALQEPGRRPSLIKLKSCEVPKTILNDVTDKRVYLFRRQTLVQKRRHFFPE
jgi:hypothetical protein